MTKNLQKCSGSESEGSIWRRRKSKEWNSNRRQTWAADDEDQGEREDQQGNKDAGLDNPGARISSN